MRRNAMQLSALHGDAQNRFLRPHSRDWQVVARALSEQQAPTTALGMKWRDIRARQR